MAKRGYTADVLRESYEQLKAFYPSKAKFVLVCHPSIRKDVEQAIKELKKERCIKVHTDDSLPTTNVWLCEEHQITESR